MSTTDLLPISGAPPRGRGDLTTELLTTSVWTEGMLREAGIPIVDVPFVSIGGGMGSFAMVDCLRIAGVPAANIKVLTTLDYRGRTTST